MSQRLIPLSTLSDETGVSLRDLSEDAASGLLPAHRVAGRWVVDREEITEYLAALDDDDGDSDEDEDHDGEDDDEDDDGDE